MEDELELMPPDVVELERADLMKLYNKDHEWHTLLVQKFNLPSASELLHSALTGFLILLPTRLLLMERPLRKRPVKKAPCDDGFRRRRAPCPSRKASQREAEHQNPQGHGDHEEVSQIRTALLHEIRVEENSQWPKSSQYRQLSPK